MKPFLTLHDPARAATYYELGIWKTDTFYTLLMKHAEERGDQLAIRDGRQQLSWGEFKARVDAMADDFVAQGLVAGNRVSIWMSNKIEAVVTFAACSREGIACNPSLHKSHTCTEIIELLKRLESAALVTEEGWGVDRAAHDFEAMLAELPFLKKVYTPNEFPVPAPSGGEPRTTWKNPDTVAYLAFTSGTTGSPKCVMHSCNTLLANARDLAYDWKIGKDTIILSLGPVSHHNAWVGVGQWLVTGCQYVLNDRTEGMSGLDWVLETKATYLIGVPTHAMDLLHELKTRNIGKLGSVRLFDLSGAPIPSVVSEAFLKLGITPQNIYGMTENSSHQYTHPDDDPDTWTSTCGRGGKSYEVRVFDAEDPDVPVGTNVVGQIGGHGGALMLGYFDNQLATEKSFNRAGWFLSGDLGSLDEAGNLSVEGRIKDLIIRGGHNIFPAHIEAKALTHDAIDMAAAFPIADDRLGEKVCLAVKSSLAADEVLQHLAAEGLSKYDMPEWFLSITDFPLTASGKILKRELVTMVARGQLEPQAVRYVDQEQK